jgi:T4 superinfection immunity protein/SH3 domain-containing protein
MEALLVLVLLILLVLYFLPTIVAAASNKRKTGAIFVLNLLLGWTLLGWVGSLVWAVADERSDSRREYEPVFVSPQETTRVSNRAAANSDTAPTWRPLPTPGQRVHLVASRIMRIDPEITARSTGEIRAGTDVTVLRTSGGWVRVQSDAGEEGWTQL